MGKTDEKKLTVEYIQFSKKVTAWGIVLVSIALFICICAVVFAALTPEEASVVASLYSAYIAIMGITIGAYQGNSSLEKWTKARYQYNEAIKGNEEKPDDIDDESEG